MSSDARTLGQLGDVAHIIRGLLADEAMRRFTAMPASLASAGLANGVSDMRVHFDLLLSVPPWHWPENACDTMLSMRSDENLWTPEDN